MLAAKKPKNEVAHLASLHALRALDAAEEKEFDAIIEMASLVCDVPMSFINLVDADRQRLKASIGLPGVTEMPREASFCADAIHQDDIFEVHDASMDPRFSDNPLVLNDPNIRFYAAVTLKPNCEENSDDENVGTLCVMDRKPRQLNETQRLLLRQLGIIASAKLAQKGALKGEKKLRDETTVISQMLDHSNEAIISLSTDGLVKHWNKGAQKLFGYTADQMIGLTLEKLLPSGNKNEHKTSLETLKKLKSPLQYDAARITKQGEEVVVSISLNPCFDEQGTLIGVTKVVRNISKRVEDGAFLKDQQQLANTIIQSQNVATFMINAEHVVVEWNKACEELTGLKAKDIIGKSGAWRGFYDEPRPCLADLVLDDLAHTAEDYYPSLGKSAFNHNGWHADAWFDLLGGKRRYVGFDATPIKNANGELIGILETVQDNTEHKLTEQAFQAEQQRLTSVLEGTQAGTWHWNYATGEYRFSEMWAEMLGYTRQELAPLNAETWQQLVNADDRDHLVETLNAHIANESELYEVEFRMAHRDGHWIWVSSRGKLLSCTVNGQAEWLHGTHTDITARKMLELDLKQAYQNLEEFTAIASHDLKSPLRGIADLVGWINEDLGTDIQDSVKHNLNRVQLRVKRLDNLIDDLLQYSHSCETSEEMHLVTPEKMVNEIIDILNMPKMFNVQVNCNVKPFNTYMTPLKTILRKSLSNAVKHHDRDDGNVAVNIYSQKEFIVFEIKDDGPGIPETAHERVFKVFQALSKGSSGMGLAVAKRLAETHGGHFELESDLGKGTLLRLFWPKKSVRIS